jgi:antitoxin component of MazEF toxin-antitoxin module
MKMIVKKWGNSAAVRIPASVMAAASLDLDQAVDIREEGVRIVIEPIKADPYELARCSIKCVLKPFRRRLTLGRLRAVRSGEIGR